MKKFLSVVLAAVFILLPCSQNANALGKQGSSAVQTALVKTAPVTKALYGWNLTDYTYHETPNSDKVFKQLSTFVIDKNAVKEESPANLAGFLLEEANGTKTSYYISETQLYTDAGVLNATAAQCKELYATATEINKNRGCPQWLVYMNPDRITLAEMHTGDISTAFTTKNISDIKSVWDVFHYLPVKAGSTVILPATAPASFDINAVLTFDSGVKYDISVKGDILTLCSSDMTFALQYTLSNPNSIKTIIALAEKLECALTEDATVVPGTLANPDTGKPVIYLYPQKPTDCTVKLDYDSLTYTYPAYNNGWEVTAYPDGRLINKADGSEHYYLFWEGNKRIDWKFESGFVVAGKDTESFLKEKLSYMGLTSREYNDFITYWVPRLADEPYNLITFAGEQYEQLAPLNVTPAPDSVLRVHMVYKPISTPVDIPEQKLKTFTRSGFTVVEWGGTIAR